MRFIHLTLIVFIGGGAFAQKKLAFEDQSYENEIRTVMLYPATGGARSNLRPPVAPIQNQNLLLEFDDLSGERNDYYVKIFHCNALWTKSTLMDLDFLSEYNEYPITEYDLSSNTSLPYVHYYFEVPPVKLPGNYLLIVYRGGNTSDLILTKRFMVYDNLATLQNDMQMQGSGNLRSNNQQLNFKVNYSRIAEVINPMESFQVVIRQNQRWDNARFKVKPSFIREDKREMEYRFFDPDQHFMAGNEFRFVDFRSLNYPGQNTGRLNRSKRPFHLYVQVDKSREGQVYAQYPDLNGGYVIENLDQPNGAISGDYLFVTFTLSSPAVNGQVHLIGSFNNWSRSHESHMVFNKDRNEYELTLFLKQGLYNYLYWVEGTDNGFQLEGSHFQTENLYEVFIYHRPFRPNADMLIGYFTLPVNVR
jgi:hypothetical protein